MGMRAVEIGMRTLDEIHEEIERLSEERTELWHRLSDQHDPEVRAEIHEIDTQLDRLWGEHRPKLENRSRMAPRRPLH